MTNVYLVLGCEDYGCTTLGGVYGSYEKALQHLDSVCEKYNFAEENSIYKYSTEIVDFESIKEEKHFNATVIDEDKFTRQIHIVILRIEVK